MIKVELTGTLPIGAFMNGEHIQEYGLLRSNGIAEKVYTDRLQDRPYTWIGNVLTVGIDHLGTHKVGVQARKTYSQSEDVQIPEAVKSLSLSGANTLLIELHRRTWQRHIKEQESMCKICGHKNIADVDLNLLKMTDKDVKKLNEKPDWSFLECDLEHGYDFQAAQILGGGPEEKMWADFDGINFNRFVFRTPTLGDAIALESMVNDPITFWRRLALKTLTKVLSIDGEGVQIAELPLNAIHTTGMRLFDEYLDRSDLSAIRSTLRDVPTIPFDYLIECQNKMCRQQTPMVIEGSELFSF